MVLGILSDSHGRVERVRRALALLEASGADCFVHCGDVGGMAVFDEFVGRTVHFVWGNTDDPNPGLIAYVQTVGLTVPRTVPLELDLQERRIQVFHGHEPEMRQALARPRADYILHGHTHAAADERIGHTRIINPGALHRARVYTVATLDLVSDVLRFHELA